MQQDKSIYIDQPLNDMSQSQVKEDPKYEKCTKQAQENIETEDPRRTR